MSYELTGSVGINSTNLVATGEQLKRSSCLFRRSLNHRMTFKPFGCPVEYDKSRSITVLRVLVLVPENNMISGDEIPKLDWLVNIFVVGRVWVPPRRLPSA